MGWWPKPAARVAPRWVVVDVETSGLDTRHDRLLAIAAVALHLRNGRAEIALGDSFELVLQQPEAGEPDRANILLHGIGVGAQRAGLDPRRALADFGSFVEGAPLVGFHVEFDRAVIERDCRALGLPGPGTQWIDLDPLATVLRPDVAARSLDEWLDTFGITCGARHRAAADALATAELLQRLWSRLAAESPAAAAGDARAALRLAAHRRWLPR